MISVKSNNKSVIIYKIINKMSSNDNGIDYRIERSTITTYEDKW